MKFRQGDFLPTLVMEAVSGEAVDLPDPKRLVHLQFRHFVDCPICNTHIAVRAKKQATDDKLKFNLLVDENNEVGKAFGVVYTFPDDLKSVYHNVFKMDIAAINDADVWLLPIPARFVIDTSGTIRDTKAEPDYRYRPDPLEALAVAKSLGA